MLASFDAHLTQTLTEQQKHDIAASLFDCDKLPQEWQGKLATKVDSCGNWTVTMQSQMTPNYNAE